MRYHPECRKYALNQSPHVSPDQNTAKFRLHIAPPEPSRMPYVSVGISVSMIPTWLGRQMLEPTETQQRHER